MVGARVVGKRTLKGRGRLAGPFVALLTVESDSTPEFPAKGVVNFTHSTRDVVVAKTDGLLLHSAASIYHIPAVRRDCAPLCANEELTSLKR